MILHKLFFPGVFSLLILCATPAFSYQQVEFVQEHGNLAKKQRLFDEARGIALFGDRIYVADAGAHRVLVLDQEGKTVRSWGEKGDGQGKFRNPAGISVDGQGMVYVSDTGNHRIQVFNKDGKFLRTIGSKGSGPRQFSSPAGIAAKDGILYVADRGNSRVQVLTADGIYLSQITWKKKKDEMEEPVDVAVDLQNRIYVLDEERNNVRVFSPAGEHLLSFGVKGKGAEGFDEPQGLAVDSRGFIYVADSGNYKMKKFNPAGKLVGHTGSEGDGPGQFRKASGLAVAGSGRVFVLDARKGTLQIFACEPGDGPLLPVASPLPSLSRQSEAAGEATGLAFRKRLWGLAGDSIAAIEVIDGRRIGGQGAGPGQFRSARGLAVDESGNFWVADTGNDRLQKFSIEGNLLHVIGKSGSGEGEFKAPSGIAVTAKGNIAVADTGNRRVQVLSPKGLFLGAFGKPGKDRGQMQEPVDVSVDGAGHLYVADRGNDRLLKFDQNGTLLWETGKTGSNDNEFRRPENVLATPDNEVFVLDAGNARVQVFDASGRFLRKFGNEGKGPGEFRSPQGLALDTVRLYVGDRGNNRVQIFTLKQTAAIPQTVTAQAKVSEIQLSWAPNAETYLEKYHLYRAQEPAGPFSAIGTTTEPFYVDKNLPSNQAFHYRVTSQAFMGNESAAAATVSAVTPRLVPSPPRKVRADAIEKTITLAWLPNAEPFVDHYRIYRSRKIEDGFEFLAKSDKVVYVDGPLADETVYYYQITVVGKEGDEGQPSEVAFAATPRASLSLPPLEIAKVELAEVFASAYKYYETNPLGKVVIRNNTAVAYPKVTLRFSIKEFMDYPTEIEIEALPPHKEITLDLKPVFSNKILDVTENTSLQSELSLTYHIEGKPRTIARSFPVTLYERHAMTWDRKEKIGGFVTPRDPVVADFSRLVIQPYVDLHPNLHSTIVYARALYAALGVYGMSYIVDPTSPYQDFSETTARVDYLQYPRDTFARKSGDCDDLSILFAAALENIGISTALVDVPGHVFILFNTGVLEADRKTLGFSDDMVVLHQGTVWIPVEMTLVGSSFTRAWQKGAEQYRDWSAKKAVEIVEVRKAWENFKPATLARSDAAAVKVTKDEIEAKFKGEIETLARKRLANLSEEYLERLKKKPNDMTALVGLGILYGENGLPAEALDQFQKALAVETGNATVLNNIGNIHFLQDRLDDAKTAYESALAQAPEDTGIMVNLSRVLLRLGKADEAKKQFQAAAAIDPRVLRRYPDVAAGTGVGR
jgi:DNA-binding beta-propeller fold protein YncE/tetratricopeptide (TPR) repeat protein